MASWIIVYWCIANRCGNSKLVFEHVNVFIIVYLLFLNYTNTVEKQIISDGKQMSQKTSVGVVYKSILIVINPGSLLHFTTLRSNFNLGMSFHLNVVQQCHNLFTTNKIP